MWKRDRSTRQIRRQDRITNRARSGLQNWMQGRVRAWGRAAVLLGAWAGAWLGGVGPVSAQPAPFEMVASSNATPVGLESNRWFNATYRYSVTQSGPATVDLDVLFDGAFAPSYSIGAPTPSDPLVITIDGFTPRHTQRGDWVGWGTRYWQATDFRIEAYDTGAYGTEGWVVVADVSGYTEREYVVQLPGSAYSAVRFTFFAAAGIGGRIGLSELFHLDPEAGRPYAGLLPENMWQVGAHVGIGTRAPQNALDVVGTVRAEEVVVESAWADFVFADGYRLMPPPELAAFIRAHGHLPGVPTAAEVQRTGVRVGETQALLLQKIEELTLYLLALHEQHAALLARLEAMEPASP